MDIKEIAERYTREEWLELSMKTKKELLINKGNCPNGSGLKTLNCCTDCNITICNETCIECWRQAIKDIKFKDEVWVKCINNLGSKNLTLNKEYMVITQGETWIEIINDSNTNYSYLMYGFKIIKEDEKVKEYTFEEVISNIKEGETYKCTNSTFVIHTITRDEVGLKFNNGELVERCGINYGQKFVKVGKLVSFNEVLYSNRKCRVYYKKYDIVNIDRYDTLDNILRNIVQFRKECDLKELITYGQWYLE